MYVVEIAAEMPIPYKRFDVFLSAANKRHLNDIIFAISAEMHLHTPPPRGRLVRLYRSRINNRRARAGAACQIYTRAWPLRRACRSFRRTEKVPPTKRHRV